MVTPSSLIRPYLLYEHLDSLAPGQVQTARRAWSKLKSGVWIGTRKINSSSTDYIYVSLWPFLHLI